VEIRIDPRALGFALVVTLVTGLAIGLLPAWQAARVNVNETLKEASRGSTGSGQRLRAGLLVAEVALARASDLGRPASHELRAPAAGAARVRAGGRVHRAARLPAQRYDDQKLVAFYEQFYQRLSTLPGSSSAALTDRVPLTGGQAPAPIAVRAGPCRR
jgi:putative ABC transport system permease protein